MRLSTHLALGLFVSLGVAACGGGDGGPGGGSPSPTPQSLSITPGTTMLRVNQLETFGGTLTLSNGQSQQVQPAWQSDNVTVLTFDNGVARGRSNGNATIIGVHQGLTATRLIRVLTDYQGFWFGDYAIRRCEDSGDWASGDFCDRQNGFYVGELLQIALDLRQQGDAVTGDVALGALDGTTSGSVGTGGRLAATGSMTIDSEGLPIAFALNPMDFGGDGDRLTGRFTVTVTAPGMRGRGLFEGELRTVVRTSADSAGTLRTGARSFATIEQLLGALRR